MSKTQHGSITITRRGTGFIFQEGTEDLIVRPGDTGGALSKDIVEYVPAGKEKGRAAAKVTKVVERHQTRFVGRITEEDGTKVFRADGKTHTPFTITEGETPLDHKVVFEFEDWSEGDALPKGAVTEVIGPVGDHETEMRALLLREGFDADFPADVRKEADMLEEKGTDMIKNEAPNRRDLRGTTTFTIDPKDAKDFDDALSIKTNEDGTYEIGVHIADVSFFVKEGSAIDTEARKRATSVYLVDRTIPMLPPVLSENLCSLRPNEDRLAMSAIFTLDQNAKILDAWYGETVIHSDKRFTYENAQESLEEGGEFHDELVIFNTLAHKLREKRDDKGQITFDTSEVQIDIDENGKPVRIYLKERKETNMLIEDFMLLANESIAAFMSGKVKDAPKTSFIYRIHDVPNADKIRDLKEFVEVLGYNLETTEDGSATGEALNALFEQVDGTPEEDMIKTAGIRSMSKAIYSTKNIGHFGLAFEHYTHFTSPIRRYPDLLVHRLVKACGDQGKMSNRLLTQLEEDALHSTEREISATEAERDSIKLKQVEFMSEKIGQEFDAVISGVFESGIFVTEKTTHADGLVHIRTLKDDYYSYEEKKYRLVGSNSGKTYQLGDEVRVKLMAANPIERTLDFTLVPEAK